MHRVVDASVAAAPARGDRRQEARAHARLLPPALLALISAPYLVLLWSPLRLSGDEVAYLSTAASLADGTPVAARAIHYPRGYPLVLAGLDRLGVATAPTFVALNLVLLAVGLAAAYVLLRSELGFGRLGATAICALLVLSRLTVWTASAALSDIPFFALAMTCLLVLAKGARRTGRAAAGWWALAALLAAAAIETRTIGIALLPPLALAAYRRLPHGAGRVAAVVLAALLAAAAVAAGVSAGYVHAAGMGWQTDRGARGVIASLGPHLRNELEQFGELALNVSRERAPSTLRPLYALAGVVVLALGLAALRRRRRALGPLDVFACSVAAVVLVWPGYDARLLLPIQPFVAASVWLALDRLRWRRAAVALVAVAGSLFVAAGAVALVRSDRLALAGSRFPALWAREAPKYGPTYRFAFSRRAHAEPPGVDRRILRLLLRYDRAAAAGAAARTTAGRRR